METNTTIEPYALQYYIAKYGTVENLTKDYIGAIDGLRLQYRQYETNPRKGGRYRREKMEHIRQQAEAIYHELLRVSLAMIDYFAARATDTPQISTEAAETVNVSAEREKAAERPQYRVWRFAKPNYAQIIVSDYSQWKVVAVLSFVWGKTQIEVSDDVANIHTIGKKELTIDKPLTELTDAEVLELIYNHTEPPQLPETPQTVDCATDTPKPRETARKPQNRGIGSAQHHQCSALGANGYAVLNDASVTMTAMNVRRDTLRDTLHSVTYVPRECSTADAAYW